MINSECENCHKPISKVINEMKLCPSCRADAEEEAEDYAKRKADEYATEKASILCIDLSIDEDIDQEEAFKKIYESVYPAAFQAWKETRLDQIYRRMLGQESEEDYED